MENNLVPLFDSTREGCHVAPTPASTPNGIRVEKASEKDWAQRLEDEYLETITNPFNSLDSAHPVPKELISICSPIAPKEGDLRVQGKWEASKRARARTEWVSHAACQIRYAEAAKRRFFEFASANGNLLYLERALLNYDILVSGSVVRHKLAENLVFIVLNLIGEDNLSPVQSLLEKNADQILKLLKPVEGNETDEEQVISLIRGLLEFSGGRKGQHTFGQEYSADDNARLYGSAVGISGTNRYGHFDPEQMRNTLARGRVFAGSDIFTRDLDQWYMDLLEHVPIGIKRGDLGLPLPILNELSVKHLNLIRVYIEQKYRTFPSLRKPDNNFLFALNWVPEVYGQQTRVFHDWASSDDGSDFYQDLIRSIREEQSAEQLSLTMATLLSYRRLLPFAASEDCPQRVDGCYLADLDALVQGHTLSNSLIVFERMIRAMIRVLNSFQIPYGCLVQFLDTVLNQDPPSPGPCDVLSEQYFMQRLDGKSHDIAAEKELAHVRVVGNEWVDWVVVRPA